MTEETTNILCYISVILVMAIVMFLSMFSYDAARSASNSFAILIHLFALG